MQIEYIWIKNYKNLLRNLNLNFGGRYKFAYNADNGNLSIDMNENFIENLFSKEYKSIKNVTAIIGENGVGKTNVIRLINEIFSNDGLYEKYIIIYRHNNKLFGYYNLIDKPKTNEKTGIKWIKNKSKNLIQDSGHVINLVHFSNVFDNSKVLTYNSRLIDISTNKLVKNYREMDENIEKIQGFDIFTEFKKSEIVKKVSLFIFLNETIDEKFNLLVNLPKEIFIEVNYIISDCMDIINSSNKIIILETKVFHEIMRYMDKIIDNDNFDKDESFVDKIFFFNFLQQILMIVVYDFEFKFERSINYELKYLLENLKNKDFNFNKDFLDLINNFLKYILIKEDLYISEEKNNVDDYNIIEETNRFENIKYKIEELQLLLYEENEEDEEFINLLINEIIEELEELEQVIDEIESTENNKCIYSLEYNMGEYNELVMNDIENTERLKQVHKKTIFSLVLKEYINFQIEDSESLLHMLNNIESKICMLINQYNQYINKNLTNNVTVSSNINDDLNIVIIEENEEIIKYINNVIQIIEYMNEIKKNGDIEEVFYEDNIEDYSLRLKIDFNDNFLKKFLYKYMSVNFNRDVIIFDWYDLSSGQNSYLDMLSRLYMIEYNKFYDSYVEDIVVLIDEGELYLHPNIQSKFLNNLMMFFQFIMKKQNIQLILTSNSPFMISDLPSENIIYLSQKHMLESLEDGNITNRTFGSNIHTLLSDTFFMKDGTIGEFSKIKINNIIDLLNLNNEEFKKMVINKKIDLKEIENIIKIIGEPVVRKKIMNLYHEKVKNIKNIHSNNTKILIEKFSKLSIEEKNEFINEIVKISREGKI